MMKTNVNVGRPLCPLANKVDHKCEPDKVPENPTKVSSSSTLQIARAILPALFSLFSCSTFGCNLLQQLGFSFNLIVIPTLLTEGQREDVQEKREYYGGEVVGHRVETASGRY